MVYRSDRKSVAAAITERAADRAARYTVYERVGRLPSLSKFGPCMVWVGSLSVAVPELEERYMLKSGTIILDGNAATDSDLARDYISVKLGDRRLRAQGYQARFFNLPRSQPIWTKPGLYPDMIYLDLQSAYWAITQVVGLDVDYYPNGTISQGIHTWDFPYTKRKVARNAIVTSGLPSKAIAIRQGRPVEISTKRRINLGLWSVVQDVLHAIAWDMVHRFGAVYVNTDGYIIPLAWAGYALDYVYSEYGLHMREKARGDAQVWGAGAYRVGDKQTHILSAMAGSVQKINDLPNRDKLREQFKFWATRRNPHYD